MNTSIVTNLARRHTSSRGAAPATSYWVGASRAELAQAMADRRTQQESAHPSDLIYGPLRCQGGSPMAQHRQRQRWQALRARRTA